MNDTGVVAGVCEFWRVLPVGIDNGDGRLLSGEEVERAYDGRAGNEGVYADAARAAVRRTLVSPLFTPEVCPKEAVLFVGGDTGDSGSVIPFIVISADLNAASRPSCMV